MLPLLPPSSCRMEELQLQSMCAGRAAAAAQRARLQKQHTAEEAHMYA